MAKKKDSKTTGTGSDKPEAPATPETPTTPPTTPAAAEGGAAPAVNDAPAGETPAAEVPAVNDAVAAPNWDTFIAPLATACSKTPADVATALKDLIGEPNADAIDCLQKEEYTPFDDIRAAIGSGVPVAKLRRAVDQLRAAPEAPAPAAAPVAGGVGIGGMAGAMQPLAVATLPQVPADFESFLSVLRAGGILKAKPGIVMSGVQVWFANRFNFAEIVDKIEAKIISVAARRGDDVPPVYDTFCRLAAERKYADIFSALGISPGTSGARKVRKTYVDEMQGKVDSILIPALRDFDTALGSWLTNGLAMEGSQAGLAGLLQQMATGVASPFAAFASAPADTTILIEEAQHFIDSANQCFGGLGARAAAMAAHESQQVRVAMQLPELPAALGYLDREDMLTGLFGKELVSIADERTERALVQWALAIIELPNKTEGADINSFLAGMFQLRPSLKWDRLIEASNPSGGGSGHGHGRTSSEM